MASPAPTQPALLRTVLGGILALAAAMGIGRFAFTPILPAMQQATPLDTAQAGLLAAANYAGYLVGAVLIAVAVPVAMRRGILMGSLVAIAATTAAMAATTNFLAWGVIRFVAGLASAGVFVLASGLVLDTLRRAGHAARSGWLYSGPGVGIAVSGLAVRAAGATVGWRGDWLILALFSALVLYPCWRWLPRGGDQKSATGATAPAQLTLPRFVVALLFAAYFLEGLGYIVTGTFLVAIVNRMPGLDGFGNAMWIVVGVAAIPSGVLWVLLGSRTGYARALALAYVAQACGILLPLLGGAGAALASAVIFGGTFLGITALTLALAGRLAPHRTARLIGMLTAIYGLGQVIGPVFAGFVAARSGGFGPALVAAAAIILLGGALMAVFHACDPSRVNWLSRRGGCDAIAARTPQNQPPRSRSTQ